MRIKNAVKFLYDPCTRFSVLNSRGFYKNVPDDKFLKMAYKARMGKTLNLEDPKTFNEKLQWLKLYDRKPIYTTMVDKFEAKKYVASIIGEEYIIPTLGVWDSVDDIDFNALPNQFVLKCNHNSGLGMYICKEKSKMDIQKVKTELRRGLAQDYYLTGREWPYKNVKRKIIAEQYMEDSKTSELRDYKFFCFNGIVKALYIATERQKQGEEVKFDFFDIYFKHLDLRQGHPNATICPKKPETFDKMKQLAEKLSKGFQQLRVDLYVVNGRIYFGEFTFFHLSGLIPFEPEEWDFKLGNLLDLSGLQATKSTS